MFPESRQFEAALQVVRELRSASFEAYLAGGCVRDLLLGREPKDYDVATSATPDAVLSLFKRTFAVGAHFGVVLVADSDEEGYVTTEVATFRSDGAYSDGRHPDAVRYTKSAEEDVRRRDFSINGLLLDPFPQGLKPDSFKELDVRAEARTLQAEPLTFQFQNELRPAVIDYVGGVADLDAGLVRAIGRPEARFEEDRLRMLRGVRFAARFGFELEPKTAEAMRQLAARIHAVSRERVRDELTKMLTEGRARRAFELLDGTAKRGSARSVAHEGRGAAAAIPPGGRRMDAYSHASQTTGAGMPADPGLGRSAARCGQAADLPPRSRPDPF
jgi:poly(A) polymerase